MAFEGVQIRSTRNGVSLVVGYRDDLAQADVVAFSLTSTTGVTAVRWDLIGRPRGSVAGGAGPEPVLLANALTSSLVVDSDAGAFHVDGTYVVRATINPGEPSETRKTVIVARLSGLTVPAPGGGVYALRKPGGMEALEDTRDPAILQGWATQDNAWRELVRLIAVGGGITETLAGAYAAGASAGDQTLGLTDAAGGGVVLDGSGGGLTGTKAVLKVLSAAGGPFAVDRATGNVGIGIAVGIEEVHVRSASPGVRLESTAGGGQAIAIENLGTVLAVINRTSATTLATFLGTGGIRADLGVGVGVDPPTAAALAMGAGSAAPVSTAGNARLRYNEVAHQFEASVHGGAYAPFGASAVLELANLSALSAFAPPSSGGVLAFVTSPVRRYYRLDRSSTLTSDGISILTASGGGRWIALSSIKHPANLAQPTFWWDPANSTGLASDENDGATSTTPLRTHDEIDRRIGDSMVPNGPTVFVMSDIPGTQRWRITTAASESNGGGGFISYQGIPSLITPPVGSGTVTAVTLPNKAAGVDQWWEVTDSNLPASWTAAGYVDNWVVFKSGATVVASGPVIFDFGGGTKRCRVGALGKTGTTIGSVNSAAGSIAVGNTYQVFRLPQAGPPYEVVDPYVSAEFFALDFQSLNFECSTSNFTHRAFCTFRAYGKFATGIDEQIFVNGALNATVFMGRASDLKASTWKNSFLSIEAEGFATSPGDLIFQASSLVVESSASARFDADVGFLDCLSGEGPFGFLRMISVQNNSKALFRGRIWGRGNTQVAIHVEDPTCWLIYATATPPQVQTSATKIEVGTRTFSFADLVENGGNGVAFPDKNTGVTSGVV